MMKEPFRKAVPVLEKIEEAGFEAYFVGGSVRDLLLNRQIGDVDIATSARPEEIKGIFSKTVDIGIEHGTVLVLYKGEGYEITTFRTEGKYEDYRRPKEVAFIRSLSEDLRRRDFTVNAMAMTKTGEIIDPFNGKTDLINKLIRTVGKAEERFNEDALRMMRAVRFVSQLSFQIEPHTLDALGNYAYLLEHIAVERKLAEFIKLLNGKNRKYAFHILIKQNLHQYLPGLANYTSELYEIAELIEDIHLNETDIWALLLIYIKDDSETFLRKWKMPVKQIRLVQSILHAYEWRKSNEWTKESVYRTGIEIALHAEKLFSIIKQLPLELQLNTIQDLFEKLPIKDRKELAVTGKDLMVWKGKGSGPWIKAMLEKIEEAILAGTVINDKNSIKEWLER